MTKKHALLIGVSGYTDPRLARLQAPAADVEALAEVLKDADIAGFDSVVSLVEPNREALIAAVDDLFSDKDRDDLVLLYFSGHGIRDDKGRLFFAVGGTRYDRPRATGIPASELKHFMDDSHSRRQVLVLDCCHAGAFMESHRAAAATPALTEETFEVSGYGREVLAATNATAYAFEGEVATGDATSRQLGKFTRLLVEGLRTGAGVADRDEITVADLFEHARRRLVAEDPRMRPQHWRERGEAPLVIARNSQARPRLPAELLAALDDQDPVRRRGAVDWLDDLIKGGDLRLRATALAELRRREPDEPDRRVHQRMRLVLQGLEEPPEPSQGHARRHSDEPRDRSSAPDLEKPGIFPQRAAGGARAVLALVHGSSPPHRVALLLPPLVFGALAAGWLWGGSVLAWVRQPLLAAAPPPSQREAATLPRQPAPVTASREPGDVFRDCPECPEMVVVPAGEFMMGSPAGEGRWDADEKPQHRVTFARAFAVGRFEVTFAEWDACAAGGGCGGYRPSDQGWGRGRRPVINVSWHDAKDYVAWLARRTGAPYRLLSEAEWEYAARAGTAGRFWTGATISTDQANYNGEVYGPGKAGVYRARTVEVGSLPASPWGLHEVHGNVGEWVEDCYKDTYDGAPSDGSVQTFYNCPDRVVRGGFWELDMEIARSASRDTAGSFARNDGIGFRVSRALTP